MLRMNTVLQQEFIQFFAEFHIPTAARIKPCRQIIVSRRAPKPLHHAFYWEFSKFPLGSLPFKPFGPESFGPSHLSNTEGLGGDARIYRDIGS